MDGKKDRQMDGQKTDAYIAHAKAGATKRENHTSMAGSSQIIFDQVIPFFRLRIF